MGVKKEMRTQRWTKQAKMPVEMLDHLHVVRHLGQRPIVKTWRGLEYNWGFWLVFVEWCLGQE